ncbi:MAG: hypothetical protein WBD00_08035, partial [Candidatus Omnitrophota bacterium]
MQSNRSIKIYITAFICFAVLLAVLWAGYTVFGHRAIGILHDRGADGLLGIITGTGAGHPLEFYLRNADFIFYEKLFPVIAFTPPFFILVFWLYSYLFGRVSPEPVSAIRGGGRCSVLLVAALSLVLMVLFYVPVLKLLNGSLIGPPGDNMKHLWNQWWMHKVLVEWDGSLTYTRYILFPKGTSLAYHAFSFYNMFLAALLSGTVGKALMYNLLMLHTFVL